MENWSFSVCRAPKFSFSACPRFLMIGAMNAVTLPPELERFADEVVASGRYRDLDEVVRTGLSLLRQAEAERDAFIASLEAARAEGERDGFFTIDEVMRDADALIEELARDRR